MNSPDFVHEYQATLTAVRGWIEETLEENREHAVPVSDLSLHRLEKVFPPDLLNRAKVVVVAEAVPLPPLSRMGFPEFARIERMPAAGVTYKDTFFVNRHCRTEGLYFHELVHVLQWDRLGVDNFLIAYGTGLIQLGYRNSPLERMAYSLQDKFNRKALPEDVVEVVQRETDAIWDRVMALLANGERQRGIMG
jgi:hypothetical protein